MTITTTTTAAVSHLALLLLVLHFPGAQTQFSMMNVANPASFMNNPLGFNSAAGRLGMGSRRGSLSVGDFIFTAIGIDNLDTNR